MKKVLSLSIAAIIITGAFWGLRTANSVYQQRNGLASYEFGEQELKEPAPLNPAHIDMRTGTYNLNARNEVMQQILGMSARDGGLNLVFQNVGPDNIGGRTRAILEVFKKPDTLLVGSVSGGLFYSYDGGAHWQPHTQFQNLETSSTIIASIHQDTLSGRIYVGTGSDFDASANAAGIAWPGYGIFVSDDFGVTFEHLESTTPDVRNQNSSSPWVAVNRISTTRNGDVYAATHRGLLKSTDKGETWNYAIFIDPNNTIPNSGRFSDVKTSKEGRIVASVNSGAFYISETGEIGSFTQVNTNGLPSVADRVCIALSESNPDHIYALYSGTDACLDGVYETTNGGDYWVKILSNHDNFQLFSNGQYCQGVYDAAIAVSPLDENTIFMGGITLWRYDGNLTRVAHEFGSPPAQDITPGYVHSDKHYFYFSPNDPNRMYATSDGGIAVTSDRGNSWSGLNKGYTTLQVYGVAHTTIPNLIMGGAQDNGTPIVLQENPNDPFVGYEVWGNDGLDCDMSQISAIVFASSQSGMVVRSDASQQNGTSFPIGFISGMGSGGPFYTVIKLWENEHDLTSKDSIEFEVKEEETAIDVSNGIVRTYDSKVYPLQSSAIVDISSISVYSGGMYLNVASDGKTLEGDGTGSVSVNTDGSLNVKVTFQEAPAENSNVYVKFGQSFNANSIIVLESDNLNSATAYKFEHRLESSLQLGDKIKVQDPVQALLASTGSGSAGGLRIYRNPLNFQKTLVPIDIPGISGAGVSCVEFTSDGDCAFVGTWSGTLYRITGLQKLYSSADIDKISVAIISGANMGSGGLTGLSLDPNDNNRMVITGGGYGASDRVKITSNAMAASPNSVTFTNVHANLPAMPVYDAEIDRNNPEIVLVGTEFGIWATQNISDGASTVWYDENEETSYVPVYDIKQQKLPWDKAKNTGTYYIGTHGRGFWTSTSLVGIKPIDAPPMSKEAFSGLKVYPNPMQFQGYIELTSSVDVNADFRIYDINGRVVKSFTERVIKGNNRIQLHVNTLRTGNYFATIQSGNSRSVAKFIVLN